MIIELLTPLMLVTAPVRIDMPEGVYNHATQTNAYADGQTTPSLTFAGTQTFAPNGRPSDNDND